MLELTLVLILLIGMPALIAWSLRKFKEWGTHSRWVVVGGAALTPVLLVILATQFADAITSAAAVYAAPALLLLSVPAAAIGYHLAKAKAKPE